MFAVFMVPSQGHHHVHFAVVAKKLLKEIYHSQGAVFKTVLQGDPKSPSVNFVLDQTGSPAGANTSFWESVRLATRFIVVSHIGYLDGPILSYKDGGVYYLVPPHAGKISYAQPWPTVDGHPEQLTTEAVLFWSRIGTSSLRGGPRKPTNRDDLRIYLLGCDGALTYAGPAARAAQCPVYGFTNSTASADTKTMLDAVAPLENLGRSPGMQMWQ